MAVVGAVAATGAFLLGRWMGTSSREIPGLRDFDAAPDGNTFVTVSRQENLVTHLNVVFSWLDELPPRN